MSYIQERMLRKAGLAPALPTKKDVKPIKKISEKRKDEIAENKLNPDDRQEKWFQERRLEMCGVCQHCNKPSFKNNDERFRFSIAHILAKRPTMFPSVATNKFNWLELCWDCHSNFDNYFLDITQLNCFADVIKKFGLMYPFIEKSERKNIPDALLQYLETEI